MKKFCALLVSLSLALGATPGKAGDRPIVVELFTSEGCSSCPPADALLAELAKRPDVLALSLHVDYWDRLGWKDPFSSPAATDRQNRYAELLGLATVYTPQIVVDGRWQAVGSEREAVEHALERAQRSRGQVPVALIADHDRARIDMGPGGEDARPASVLLFAFDRRQVSAVKRGENGGRTLAHVDVVRGIQEVGRFDGGLRQIETSIRGNPDRIAALVQAADGRVLGVAIADVKPN